MSTTLVHIDWQNPPYKVFHVWFILEYSHIYVFLIQFKCAEFFAGNINPEQDFMQRRENGDLEIPLYGFATINHATDNFSVNNVLGRGGFRLVYKVFT